MDDLQSENLGRNEEVDVGESANVNEIEKEVGVETSTEETTQSNRKKCHQFGRCLTR